MPTGASATSTICARDYDAAYAEFRRELEYVSTSDHALRERTLIELHQKLSAVHHARGEDAEARSLWRPGHPGARAPGGGGG